MDEQNQKSTELSVSNTTKDGGVWKYATFILIVILIVGGIVFLNNGKTTGNTVNNGGSADLSVFAKDSSLYPSVGPTDAKVTVIEFSDFQCPFCALASGLPAFGNQYASQYGDLIGSAGKVQKLAEDGKIRFIYVPMAFLGTESEYATEAALCANEQGKFFEMHDVIFAAHDGKENTGKFNKDQLKILSQKVSGLDSTKFNQCLDSGKYNSKAKVITTTGLGVVKGTPAFFVNGVQASAGWSDLSSKISASGISVN